MTCLVLAAYAVVRNFAELTRVSPAIRGLSPLDVKVSPCCSMQRATVEKSLLSQGGTVTLISMVNSFPFVEIRFLKLVREPTHSKYCVNDVVDSFSPCGMVLALFPHGI